MTQFRFTLALGLALCTANAAAQGFDETRSEFGKFLEDVFVNQLRLDPEKAAVIGIDTGNDRWTPRNRVAQLEVLRALEEASATLTSKYPRESLSNEDQLNHSIFSFDLDIAIEAQNYREHEYLAGPIRGVHLQILSILIEYHRIESLRDANDFIARVEAVSSPIDEAIRELNVRKMNGIIMPARLHELAIVQLDSILTGHPIDDAQEKHVILAAFEKKIAALDVSEQIRESLLTRLSHGLTEEFGPAFARLRSHLQESKRVAPDDIGVWSLPGGAGYYRHRVRKMSTSDWTPQQIHDFGVAEVARIRLEMDSTRRQIDYDGSLAELLHFMDSDPQFLFEDSEAGRSELIAAATELLDSAADAADDVFGIRPKATVKIELMEGFLSTTNIKAYYVEPSESGDRPGSIAINGAKEAAVSRWILPTIIFHEGIPGHHFHIGLMLEMDELPKFRKFAGYAASLEGWALYTEQLADEIGLYRSPQEKLGQLWMELLRASRCVVDTGIHFKKWRRQEAIEYFVNEAFQPREYAESQVDRLAGYPGQGLAYTLGKRAILDARDLSATLLGDSFSLKAFHNQILEAGAIPIPVLHELINNWISTQLANTDATIGERSR